MANTTRILLLISAIAFALGFTDILWGIGWPVAAVAFGLYLILTVLRKEAALFDVEQKQRLARAG